jgi:hypothetical protein
VNRDAYRRVAQARLVDAQVLLRARRYVGAYYLAGYAVEAALKACIARQFRAATIPDKGSVDKLYVHNLVALVRFANLVDALDAERRRDSLFGAHWQTVQGWSAESRYLLTQPAIEAHNMVDGVADRAHGVLRWLKQHW